MSVPTNLIPTKITGLPEYTGSSTLGYLPYILSGVTYKVQFANIAAVGAVPSTRIIASGTGLAGGGDLSADRVISIAAGGVGVTQLSLTGVTAGTYGSGSDVPVLTVDATGRVTSATTAALSVTGFVPTSRTVTAGNGLTGGGSLASNITLSADFSATTPLALGSASAGVANTLSRGDHIHPALDLSDTNQTQGALPLGRGGTGDGLSPVAGAVVYSTGTKFALSALGSAGQVLISNGTGAPSWLTLTGTGTVTSVNLTAGTGISVSGGPITAAGSINVVNTAPDQVVALTGAGTTTVTGTYPNFTITSTGGTGTVTSVSGTGTVSGLSLSGTVTSAGSLTLGGTLVVTASDFASQTANTILAAPNGSAGVPTFRSLVAADVPTLNQNTTGTASNVTGIVAVLNGGTGQSSYTDGQLLIGNTTGNTLTKTTLTAGTNVSITNGSGAITINATDAFVGTVTSVSGTGTVNGITLTGTVTSSGSLTLGGTLSGVSLTSQVSGTLPIANGGTNGTSTPTAGAVPYGTGTAYAFSAVGSVGQVLTSAGAGAPTWATPTTGTVTSVTGTAPVVSSGGTTPAISMAAATTSVDGYLTSTDWTTFNNKGSGTVTSVNLTAGTGVSVSGGPITSSGAITVTNTAPDQIVSLTGSGATTVTGTYPSFTISSTAGTGTVTSVGGTGTVNGITLTGTVTTSGSLTLGGTLSGVDLTTQVTGTLPVANGGTGAATLTANNVLLGNGTSAVQVVAPGTTGNVLTSNGTTWTSAAAPSSAVSYPQNIQSSDYTLVLGDAGKQIFHPTSDTFTRTYTIPANASVAFPIGTVVLFTVENGGTPVNVAITTDTLVRGDGLTGTALVSGNNTLMCIKVTATKWMANYLFQVAIATAPAQNIALAVSSSPYIDAYPWSGSAFGTKFSNPATLPTGFGNGIAFSPANNAVAVAHTTSPFVTAYPWSTAGFGTKYTNPATLPAGIGNAIAFNPTATAVAVAHNTSPFISAYAWSGAGFGTKFTDPATLPTNVGRSVAFTPANDAIAVAQILTPFVNVYPFSGSGFGTKFANPATLPTGNGVGVAFSPNSDAIAVAHVASPYVSVYPWNISTGFGTKYTNPATLPTGDGAKVAFSPAGDAIAVAHTTSPFVTAYPWSIAGFGTKYTNPATLPTGNGLSVAFSLTGLNIAVGHTSSPNVSVYPWSASGFGVKYADPATGLSGEGRGVAFNYSV